MTYTIRLREEAEFDIKEAASWYESQKLGLGHEFLDIVLDELDSIEQSPLSYPIVHRNVHRAVLPRFPFAIFYFLQDPEISVISVMHGSRHPSRWQRRTYQAQAIGTGVPPVLVVGVCAPCHTWSDRIVSLYEDRISYHVEAPGHQNPVRTSRV